MKIYIIAGEASGDLHASNLLKALHQKADTRVVCRAWGGEKLEQAGATVVKNYRDLAFMGFWEVLKNIRTILSNFHFCRQDILQFDPDVLVLVDYPGFNLRMARWAKRQGIRVVYYISPQIWAWHRSRVHQIRRYVDKMLVILPFEKDFFERYGVEVEFVGHPLLDELAKLPARSVPPDEQWIALLPGSRRQEVQRILPKMLKVVSAFPHEKFVVAGAANLPVEIYHKLMPDLPNLTLEHDKTYEILQHSKAALVKSGTSTLETALLDVPQVVCYAGNPVSYFIARRLVEVRYISLVNLILDRPLVTELIQQDLHFDNLKAALTQILDKKHAAALRQGYQLLRQQLGSGGASLRAAEAILRCNEKM